MVETVTAEVTDAKGTKAKVKSTTVDKIVQEKGVCCREWASQSALPHPTCMLTKFRCMRAVQWSMTSPCAPPSWRGRLCASCPGTWPA